MTDPQQPTVLVFPGQYIAADSAALRGQHRHLLLTRLTLGLLLVGPAASIPTFSDADCRRGQGLIVALSFFSTVIISGLLRAKQFEKVWYNGRAVAESVKSMTWKYVMRAEPYTDAGGDDTFRRDLLAVTREAGGSMAEGMGAVVEGAPAISAEMRGTRSLGWRLRLAMYLNDRIINQQHWYATKSAQNVRHANVAFWVFLCLQIAAVLWSIARVGWVDLPNSVVGLLAAGSSGLLAWSGLKRHGELAESYSAAAQELSIVRSLGEELQHEAELSGFVCDAENAISREHTAWRARREVR